MAMNKTYHPRGKMVHGFRVGEHPLYNAWASMKASCNYPNTPGYKNYGGRGISYCKRWEHFENFAVDMWPKPDGLSLERKNNDKNYSPTNCIWANAAQQARNRRRFANNTTGPTGVIPCPSGSFNARYDVDKQRYDLGNFDTVEEAVKRRNRFIKLFNAKDERYKDMLGSNDNRRLRRDSSTGVKGITSYPWGYMVRKHVDGKRIYLGVVKTFKEAKTLLRGAT